uniref:Uncharacterized protein n=1 Tax=Lactuca sativa TaxID=4236 RepID=A0A9R1WWZ4_LACSA|nr:hypothetical protein LSAT_V11C800391050 [Lactuca sativa]
MIADEPEEDQGGTHDVGPDEYTDTDNKFDEVEDDMEEGQDSGEDSATSPYSEAQPNHPTPPVNPAKENRSPEAEIAALRQQLFAMEARTVRAEHERDEVIGGMTEMAQLLAQHFGI